MVTTSTRTSEVGEPAPSSPDGPGGKGASRHRFYAEILVISLAALLLEISYTRVISFKFFYYYTYMVIGLALLGIGCGGVVVAVSGRLRRIPTASVIQWGSLLGAASVVIGYVVVATVSIDTLAIWDYGTRDSASNLARLVVICLALFASFVAIGVAIAVLFSRRSEHISRLYFADLMGAGLACAVAVTLISWLGPPATIMSAALLLAATGASVALRRGSRLGVGLGALSVIVLATFVVAPDLLPEQVPDASKDETASAATLRTAWSPIFRVDAVQLSDDVILLYHDGLPGSAISRWDGDTASLTHFDSDPRSLPFGVLDETVDDVAIIGAAGGNEILASLYHDAEGVDAVELNPATHDLVTDEFAEFAGNLAEHPAVNYLTDDGRSFLSRSDDFYDLIWFPAPDSYAASNAATSGAFVLSESYLYTTEMLTESFDRLADGGAVATQFGEFDYAGKPIRTLRYVATARQALDEAGIDDPRDHLIVITAPAGTFGNTLSTILVSPEPFTDTDVEGAEAVVAQVDDAEIQYAPGREGDNPVSELITLDDDQLDAFHDAYPYAVTPIDDDGPFFWHFSRFRDVIRDLGEPLSRPDLEIDIGERVLLLLLGVAVLMAAVFLLLPFIAIRDTWRTLPRKGRSALYFAAVGLGFIFFEIVLIQRLVLFLGYPTYSLTVTLASLLLSTGVGAYLSGRYEHRTRVVPFLAVAVVVLTAFYAFALPGITDSLMDAPFGLRVLMAFAVLFPLGICLGTFMPVGLGAVADLADHPDEYVAWGWAVNGFFSVIGAVLTTILAMMFGFQTVLFVALALYLAALSLLRGLLRPDDATPRGRRATQLVST